MTFTPKDWRNSPDTTTPVSAEALEDLEERLSDYTDSVGTGGVELGYAEITSDDTVTTSEHDITGLAVTVTVATRPIVIYVSGPAIKNDTTGAAFGFQIKEGATLLGNSTYGTNASTINIPYPVSRRIRLAPSAGTHTYKVTLFAAFAGTTTLSASSDSTCSIQVVEV